jgi:hypothetical protein
MQPPSRVRTTSTRLRLVAGLALACALAAIFTPASADPVVVFQTIQPGMTYQEVRTVLAEPEVAQPRARSFGTPVKEAQAALRGEPSFEMQEWGRVDSAWEYEPERLRPWRAQNRLPLSTAERGMYTVRQWGVGNTQSYSFIAIFDEQAVLVCRYWTVPTESRFRGWIWRTFGI